MKKKYSTKRSLIASLLVLCLCLSSFVGTTFAWFTDSVTSANNIIKSGNLDVELYYQAEGDTGWTKVTESTNVFKETLWEPGHTEVVKLKVVNEGSLALKYVLGVNVASEVGSTNVYDTPFLLSEYIKFGIVDGEKSYNTKGEAIAAVDASATALKTAYNSDPTVLDNTTTEKIVTMVVYMPTSVGNEANYKEGAIAPSINLGLNLFATQATVEKDSFDNQYDKDSAVMSAEEAQAALDSAVPGTTIQLAPGVNYGTLVFGRNASSQVVDISDLGGDATGNERYSRYENITILGAAGATVDQITFDNGREDANAIWNYIDVKNLTIKNVTFSGASNAVKIPDGFAIAIDGLSLVNCKMIDTEGNDRFVYQPHSGYKTMNDKTTGEYVMTSGVKNLTITGCEITGAKQVIEARAMENLTITNNTFNGIKSRDILLSRDSKHPAYYTGTITITGNTSINGEERFVRMAGAGDATVVIKDNTINNYMGADADYIKVTDSSNSAGLVTIDNNSVTYAWNGTTPTAKPDSLVVDTTSKIISIESAPALAYLNTLVNDPNFYNNYGSKWHYTVELKVSVDLMNNPWTPIALSNLVAFKGNDNVIKNLNVNTSADNAGFFGTVSCNDIGVTYVRDLSIVNATVNGAQKVGAVAGSAPQGDFSNVTVDNATVIGTKYVGGIFGGGNGAANNCTVKNSSITIPAGGAKEAGGIIGYLSNDGKGATQNKIIAGNKLENVTVTAPTIASGIVAQPNSSNKGGTIIEIKNNSMKNVTVITTSVADGDLYVSNNVGGKSKLSGNTADGCNVLFKIYGLTFDTDGANSGVITVSDKEGLLNLPKLVNEWASLFSNGEGTEYSNYAKVNGGAGTDYYYYWGWKIELTADIDLGGAEIAPIDLGHRSVFDGHGHTIKNAKVVTDASAENEAGLFIANKCAMKNLVLDNIHVTGSNVGGSTAGILAGSCNAGVSNITITNSSVTGGKYTGGVVGYGYTDVLNCTLTNVTVKGGYKLGGLIGYICASSSNTGEVTGNTLTDCTVDGIGGGVFAGGKDKYVIGQVVGNYNCDGTCNNNTVTNMTSSVTVAIGEIEASKTVTQ